MKFSAPIVGKSSNNQSSTDTDGRAVSFSVTTSSTAASPTQPFIYTSVVDDSHGAYSSTTGQYKIAVPGRYTFNANTYTGTTSAAIGLYRNGTMIFQGPSTVGNSSVANMSYTGPFALNDLVDVRPLAAATGSGTAAGTLFSGSRVSGNAAISLGETIACAYNSGTNQQTLTNNALTTINVYTVKEYDTHGAFNTTTGTFTAPAPGIYTVQTGLQFGVNATGSRYAYIQSPGSSGKLLNYQNGNGSIPTQLMGGCSFRLATGGQIFIQAVQSSGGALATANDGTGTFICITKTG